MVFVLVSNEYVTVYLNGGTKETALDVYRALGGAFTLKPVNIEPNASGTTEPPHAVPQRFLVEGPGRPISTDHRLVGEITAEIVGAVDRVSYVVDALRSVADVGEPSTDEQGEDVRVMLHLGPA